MPEDPAATLRSLADAVNGRDRKAAFACLAPDVIWNATGELFGDQLHYHGREEVWGYLQWLDESFGNVRVDLESLERVGNQVVARVHLHTTTRDGGAESDLSFTAVARFKAGRVSRVENYVDHDEAMNDAELRAAE